MNDVPSSNDVPIARPIQGVRYAEPANGVVRPTHARLAALVIFACGATTLAVAAWLRPDPRGMGTHQQLGAGPCGMLVVTGYPCPTCGMTTAFSYLMHGAPLRSFLAQPAGFVLALLTAAATIYAAVVVIRGSFPGAWRLQRVSPFWLYFSLLMLLLAGWIYKIIAGLIDGSLPMASVRL